MSRQNRAAPLLDSILMFAILMMAGCGGSSSGNSSQSSNPPAETAPGTASSISKDGIRWTFSQPVPVGQFVNGYYYAVGPVTITVTDPTPTTAAPYEDGSLVNLPTANGKSGFGSRLNDGNDQSWWFHATLRSYPPIDLKPGDAPVSTISLPQTLTAINCQCPQSAPP